MVCAKSFRTIISNCRRRYFLTAAEFAKSNPFISRTFAENVMILAFCFSILNKRILDITDSKFSEKHNQNNSSFRKISSFRALPSSERISNPNFPTFSMTYRMAKFSINGTRSNRIFSVTLYSGTNPFLSVTIYRGVNSFIVMTCSNYIVCMSISRPTPFVSVTIYGGTNPLASDIQI